MSINKEKYKEILAELNGKAVLVAVSKTKTAEDIQAFYDEGQRDFGENYVQELVDKEAILPKDIRWHFIGHLQRNKVKYIAPFIHLIHGVDNFKLLDEINIQAIKNNRIIDCLLQVHISQEETKFGFDQEELLPLINTVSKYQELNQLKNIKIDGLMGMASFSSDIQLVRNEFKKLRQLFDQLQTSKSKLQTLSMGMSSDYKIAIEEGGNMIRIGSLLFGERNYNK
jgi:PLP dependent protein